MSGYTKLFGSIVRSTIWGEPNHVRIVWVTMLALADRDGRIEASVPGLAHEARVNLAECREALSLFLAPDPDSRTKAHDGRRIEEIPGGWRLLNYEVYREKMSRDDQREKAAERKRRQRERERNSEGVTKRDGHKKSRVSRQAEADTKAEAVKKDPNGSSSSKSPTPVQVVFGYWQDQLNHPQAKLSPKRSKAIKGRLKDGFSVDDLKAAIRGIKSSPHNMGRNDTGQVYDDIELICRDPEHVERFRDLDGKGGLKATPGARVLGQHDDGSFRL